MRQKKPSQRVHSKETRQDMLAKALNIPPWRRSRVPRAQLRHLMDDISDVDSYLEMRMLRCTGHLMRRQDEHPTLTSMAMGGQLDMEACFGMRQKKPSQRVHSK